MLARYTMYDRRKRPPSDPLPNGIRQDARWRTKHPLRPTNEVVTKYLASPGDEAWRSFRTTYFAVLEQRFSENRTEFDALAELATSDDVFLGCSCPTKSNPRVDRCHTWLALEFMQRKYPDLSVVFPETSQGGSTC